MHQEIIQKQTDHKAEMIRRKADRLITEFDHRDPFVLARRMGISLYFNDFEDLLGMYTVIKRNRCIFLNRNLAEVQARLVLAHELGHDQLHRQLLKEHGFYSDQSLFRLSTVSEAEANQFAAHLLLDEQEILPLLTQDYTDEQIAAQLGVDLNLLLLKLDLMQKSQPLNLRLRWKPRSNFIADMNAKHPGSSL